jgi:hypothetical protein
MASQRIASDLLVRNVGERLPTALRYQELLEVGSGTVQKALRDLENVGAVQTQARGHQGTFILELRMDKLWAIAGLGSVTGVMPLPNSTEWAGLATGLRSEFEKLGVPLQALYIHGSYNRAALVAEGKADFAVLSREAAGHAATQKGEWSTLDFGPWTYYSYDSLVVLLRPGMVDMDGSARADEGQKARGIRVVGIDPDSYDHHQLTLAEFPEGTGLEYVHCAYPHIPAAVAKGEVDAAVWNRTMLSIPLELVGVAVRPLLREDAISLSRSLNHAVLLTRGTRPEIGTLLGRINRKSVTEIQSRVLSQEILPMY